MTDLAEVLSPRGTRFEDRNQGLAGTAHTMGVRHLLKYAPEMGAVAGYAANLGVKPGDSAALQAQYIAGLLPIVMSKLLGLIEETVTIDEPAGRKLADLPHSCLPVVAEAWLKENFSEGRLNPWLGALERGIQTMTNRRVSISETLSRFSSAPATTSERSSSAPQGQQDSHTKDGA